MRRQLQGGVGIDRRLILQLLAARIFLRPAAAEPAPKQAWVTFAIDGVAARKYLNNELRDRVQHVCGALRLALKGPLSIKDDAVLAPLAQVDDAARLIAALPGVDPTIRPALEPSEGLSVTRAPDGVVRIALTELARHSRARLWLDRGRLTFEQALSRSPRTQCSSLPLPDGESFVLTFEHLSRAQWAGWIGGRVDLFVFGKFSIAPLAPPAATGERVNFPRSLAEGASAPPVAIDTEKWLNSLEDMVVARVEGGGSGERLVLQWTRPGVAEINRQALPTGDKTSLALMFDKALAALIELDGAATDGVMRCRVTAGLAARRLSELILLSGSAPPLKQVDAHFA
jgi:hypothetical protein